MLRSLQGLVLPPSLILGCILLSGCALNNNGLMKEGQKRQVPLLIYGTSWNNPYIWSPGDPLYIEFINTQGQQIATVELHVEYCSVKGSIKDEDWLTMRGPFLPGTSYKIAPSGVNPNHDHYVGRLLHLVITAINVKDVGGIEHLYTSDIARFLSPGVSNFCANNPS